MGGNTIHDNTCKHLITNEIDGFLVCCSCGLVLDNLCLEKQHTLNEQPKNLNNKKDFILKLEENLYEIYQKNFISFSVLKSAEELISSWFEKKVPMKKYYLPYSIYYAACLEKFPLTLKEISIFLDIPVKHFCKLEKILPIDNNTPFENYIDKYSYYFNLKYQQRKKIHSLIKYFQNKFNTTPNTCFAVCLFFLDLNINEKKVTDICTVSKYTLRKYVKLFQKEISLSADV